MFRPFHQFTSVVTILLILFSSCTRDQDKRFEKLEASQTGIDFNNEIIPTPELNIFNYLYFYDGAGVAAGDLTGNGLPDLYFTSNSGENRLYLNKGEFEFEDITERAFEEGLPQYWSTGVTFVDINNDGLLDIYVSNVGGHMNFDGKNQLFINQGTDEMGIPWFTEEAAFYGLDLQGLATQAVFFDYDLDGDLDMFMLNHSVHSFGTYTYSTLRQESHPLAGDKLMRNDNGTFVDVTEEAGIFNSPLGYGLGVGIADLNGDGWPDIYVGNDFHEDDYLYLNNGDGTFTEFLEEMIQHTSYSSMGNDLIDINNDGLMDIYSLDMMPEAYELQRTSVIEDPYDLYLTKLAYGYKHQFTRNTLQLNRGNGKFSEIGMYLGVHATDWSWAALGADFNNNGYTDLFVSNGIYGRSNELDYIHFITQDHIQQRLEGELTEEDVRLAEHAPQVKISNYMFANRGGLNFENVSRKWGLDHPSYSSGAAYADLNGDGSLDLIINNVNQPAAIYRNRTRELDPEAAFLKVKLEGPATNRYGIGARVTIRQEDSEEILVRELYPVRGFQSSVEPLLHFGLGTVDKVGELEIRWPDGKAERLKGLDVNQTLTLRYEDAVMMTATAEENEEPLFIEITDQLNVDFRHRENDFIEFNREPLIPHMVSREGPALAVTDVNSDGLDDIYIGGARRQSGALFLQQADGTFAEKEVAAFDEDLNYEDVDAHFADFTGNGLPDLLVVSGGNEFTGTSEYMRPRFYINQGNGEFVRDTERMPDLYLTGSVAAITDVNGDNLPDIFIGARAVPWSYGSRPESYLLINEGDGYFKIDESDFGKRFADVGMVTDAKWADMDGDGLPDLVVASEWEPVQIIYHDPAKDKMEMPHSSGLWNTLEIADMTGDGRPDIIAGNLGLNSKYQASEEIPLRMYVEDFDGNGILEQIVTYIDSDGRERLFATRDELVEQLPYIGERFSTYREFAAADLTEVIDRNIMNRALTYEVTELRSVMFLNNASGFEKTPLPQAVQFYPVQSTYITEFNGNGRMDLVTAGNFFNANIQRGRYDAGYGSLLLNEGEGKLSEYSNSHMNWYLEGEIRQLEGIRIGNSEVLITAENNGAVRFFRINREGGNN